MIIRYYMKAAPSVDFLEKDVPPSVGIWLGAKIVSAYMKKHKRATIKDLLETTDYHEMLKESGYMKS